MRRLTLLALALALAPLAAQTPRLVLDLPPAADARIVGLTVGLEQLSSLYQQRLDGAGVAAVALLNGAECALPTQVNLLPGGNEAMVTIAVPAGASDPSLRLLGAPVTTAAIEPLQVTQEGNKVTVAGLSYQVLHDAAKMGGLPSRFELRPSGKVWDTFLVNDRLYDKVTKRAFYLRNDAQPRVEVLAAGPLRAVVRVRARYLDGQGQAPASQPQASYTFTYLAGSPLVTVEAELSQATPFAWSELHFLELHYADQSFTHWLGGDPLTEAALTAEKKTHTKPWAALREGDSVVGLVGPSSARIYDGRGEYGTYLHGPWDTWSQTSARYAKSIYLSGAAAAATDLPRAAAAWRPL
ncbi:MAG: hypothetical protein HUU35_18355, partial [Armatimonadetes bacterium]|nr:hypothetical protein [Armatimonadota bacterium]